jgi:phage portal protein BeeE
LWVENQTKPKAERLTLREIGKALNINKSAIRDAESQSSADRLVGRNVLGATVSRYVKQARAMIENTAAGKFPLM